MEKSINAYKTIGEVVKILNLKSKKGNLPPTHDTFLGKKFKQIKPKFLMEIEDTMMKKTSNYLKRFIIY